MTQRRKWTAIPGLIALAIGAIALSAYSGASSSQNSSPVQPIKFPHPLHAAGKMNMNCLYCHNAAGKSPDPGLPAVSTCMGCHLISGADKPEVQKLAKFYAGGTGKPIPWIRIHKLPEYVRFPHMRHVNAGVTCQTCHGPIQEMTQVYQFASLNMGWCVKCHVNGYDPRAGARATGIVDTSTVPTPDSQLMRARYDCASCHY
jgi:hypothetical protein